MTRTEIDQLFLRRQQVWKRRDGEALGAFHAEDGIVKSPIFGTLKGRKAITESYVNLFRTFADWDLEATRLIVEGPHAAQAFTAQATHTHELFGVPATQRRCEIHGVLFMDLDRDGKVKREERFYDFTSLLLQIGVLKAKPAF